MRHFVFDFYGTLFDMHSAAQRHKDEIGPNWERLSQLWRAKHLEYTWIYSGTGRHTTFRRLAGLGLDYAIASIGGIPAGLRDRLLDDYRVLSPFPEVPEVLADLRQGEAKLAVLTNGDPDLVHSALDAAGLGESFDAVITVHEVGVFKPNMKVYRLASERLGVKASEISFQSSNRWDIAGAHVFGMHTAWINRFGAPDEYPDMPADCILADLRPLLADLT